MREGGRGEESELDWDRRGLGDGDEGGRRRRDGRERGERKVTGKAAEEQGEGRRGGWKCEWGQENQKVPYCDKLPDNIALHLVKTRQVSLFFTSFRGSTSPKRRAKVNRPVCDVTRGRRPSRATASGPLPAAFVPIQSSRG